MILRSIPQERYWVAPNAAFDGCGLPFDSRGLLAYLSGKPPEWEVSVKDIMREGDVGRDLAYRMLQDLETAGFLCRSQRRGPSGAYLRNDYVVSPFREMIEAVRSQEDSQWANSPLPAEPDTAEPLTAEPDTYKEQSSSNDVLMAQVPAPLSEGVKWALVFNCIAEEFGRGSTFTQRGKPRAWAGLLVGALGRESGDDPVKAANLFKEWVRDMKKAKLWSYISAQRALERLERWIIGRRDSGKMAEERQQPKYEALYG